MYVLCTTRKVVVTLIVRRRTRVWGCVVGWGWEGPRVLLDRVTRVVPVEQGEGEYRSPAV